MANGCVDGMEDNPDDEIKDTDSVFQNSELKSGISMKNYKNNNNWKDEEQQQEEENQRLTQ